ncbi:hypothetical protein CP533_3571 [Ophiocordyceps camponoti-saundersi (nom. inval.)]|nr:hypothetical protein CP533_3571 [Ophiocordyceps camponoti-saundersi (nom. inval.)]
MKVAVIGGGPGGLATLKFLSTAHLFFPVEPIEVRLFEAEDRIGGTFVYRVYEEAEVRVIVLDPYFLSLLLLLPTLTTLKLVSSKYLTAFSDFRLSTDAPDFVTPKAYVAYLGAYVEAFHLGSAIECQARVTGIRRGPGGVGHVLTIRKPEGREFRWNCDAVAVCTGLHVDPYVPHIPGIEKVPVVMHSSRLKRREQFGRGANIVVCGAGETAMDLAHLAVTSTTASVTICHRDGWFCAPKIIPTPRLHSPTRPNKPVDTSVASLFDTAYAHPVLQRSRLLWLAYDQWVKKMHWLISGTEEGPDQWQGHISRDRKKLDSIFLCKSNRALPYISEGHRSRSWWNRLRTSIINVPLNDTGGRRIDVMKWPSHVDADGFMHVTEDKSGVRRRIRADVVVLATGYSADFPFLGPDYPRPSQADIRGVYKSDDVSLAFIGFVRPAIGAIPPLAELQAQLWVLRLLQARFPTAMPRGPDRDALPTYELDFGLHPRCGYDFFASKGGVDHEAYAYQLALDMGAAPTVTYIARKGLRLFFTWAMGSNFNPKFRLVGPWRWESGAEAIMRGELYAVVRRSGGLLCERRSIGWRRWRQSADDWATDLITYTLIPLAPTWCPLSSALGLPILAMARNSVQPHGWAALKLPNETLRVLQITPNTTISLGKYGSFPSNLLIERPFHLTYEVQERREGESFSRLRVVPGTELNADLLAETADDETPVEEPTLVDGDDEAEAESVVVAQDEDEDPGGSSRQTLTTAEIEDLKRRGVDAGKELVAKLMLSHTALDQKSAFSLAKYRLLKERKFLRRFTVLPVDVPLLARWMLEVREPAKILDMRLELIGLVSCWADVHFGGSNGRWLAVDDTGGLLVAAMAESMGILYRDDAAAETETETENTKPDDTNDTKPDETIKIEETSPKRQRTSFSRRRPRRGKDMDDHYASGNTITLLHANSQPNLSLLRYFDYDASDPNPPAPHHPLFTHLLAISWLQLVSPNDDPAYAERPPDVSAEDLASWKPNRRGNYFRKRRRWARIHQVVDGTRAGGFCGLAVASTMDPVSVLRHALPLLAGGSPIAVYSPHIEPLTRLADCFTIARRAAWLSSPPAAAEGLTAAELERWEGTTEFPLNPTLVLGATVQTSRAKRWQVLPGRTHPYMTARGGSEGYVFTGWRALPAEGRVSARGKFQKKKVGGGT